MCEFNAQDFANMAWAFARMNLLDVKLFRALAREAERRVSEFNAQHVATTAWAFANSSQSGKKLLSVLAREAKRRVKEIYS